MRRRGISGAQPCARVTHPWSHRDGYPVKLTIAQVTRTVPTARLRGAPLRLIPPGVESALGEGGEVAARLIPPVCHPDHPPGRFRALQQGEQLAAAGLLALSDHPHPAVLEVLGPAHQAEFQRPRPGPPAESDTLNPALHPRGEPGLPIRDHGRDRAVPGGRAPRTPPRADPGARPPRTPPRGRG